MNARFRAALALPTLLTLLTLLNLTASLSAQMRRSDMAVESAIVVLDEFLDLSSKQIPARLLADAKAVAIVPNVFKGGLIVGVRHGRGVLLLRDANGQWLLPTFVTITGGSVGWQAGIQSTDLVLVFKSKRSTDNLLRGKVTIGVDVAAAAGPIGRNAAAATDAQLAAEIFSFSRSRGLFAGVSIDGASLQIDFPAQQAYYLAGPAPPAAVKLATRLSQHAGGGALAAPLLAPPNASDIERQIAAAAQQLNSKLDPTWREYLQLPMAPDGRLAAAQIDAVVSRYDAVATDPKYGTLQREPLFRTVHLLLKQYQQQSPPEPLQLPAPPAAPQRR